MLTAKTMEKNFADMTPDEKNEWLFEQSQKLHEKMMNKWELPEKMQVRIEPIEYFYNECFYNDSVVIIIGSHVPK